MSGEAPRLWLLLGRKEGDNAQLRALARSLGLPFAEKRLRYRAAEFVLGRLFGTRLLGIDRAASDPLEAPWPELVLSAGRRNEPAARHVKKRSGGRTRIVHLGRPWSRPEHWDLVVTTPQYELPPAANVLEIDLPIHVVDRDRGADRAERLRAELQDLERPFTALLLGGHAGEFRLSGRRVPALLSGLEDLLAGLGGSLLVAGGPRTPPAVLDRVAERFAGRGRIYRFRPDDPENPYHAYLRLADGFVVTADSISMTAEAMATGKPVRVFDTRVGSRSRPFFRDRDGWRWRPLVQRLSRMLAPRRLRRDPMRIHRRLVAEGRIGWLGGAPPAAPRADDGRADLERVRARVLRLLGD